jgi:hypothetical protein
MFRDNKEKAADKTTLDEALLAAINDEGDDDSDWKHWDLPTCCSVIFELKTTLCLKQNLQQLHESATFWFPCQCNLANKKAQARKLAVPAASFVARGQADAPCRASTQKAQKPDRMSPS